MNLPRLSIRHPVAVVMICAIVIVLGFIAVGETPLEMMPDIEFPIVAIMTTYEGAGPQEVENLISRPIEEAVATLSGLESVSSTSSRGSSIVLAQFDWGRDMDFAALDVREAVEGIRRSLPSDAETPLVLKFDPSMIPVMAITLGGKADPAELRRLAEDVVQPRLERLEGVASVGVAGGLEREIQITLHPGRLQVHGVALDQVLEVLQEENIDLPGGSGVLREREYIVRTTGQFQDLDELANLHIPVGLEAAVPLRHVADIEDTYKEQEVLTRLNFEPAVGLSVQKEDGANTVQVARNVRATLDAVLAEMDTDLEAVIVFDQAEMIEDSLLNVAKNGLIGGLMAAIVLFFFLRHVPALLVVVAAIPLSTVGAFVLLYFAGMSLNLISLGGLALGVGMLVDNAIVVLENVFRHRKEGSSAEEAAEKGTNEVGMAIFASTLTTVAVFMPVVFTQGIARQLFQDMAVTVSFTLVASLIVALSLVPLLAARWLKGKVDREGANGASSSPSFASSGSPHSLLSSGSPESAEPGVGGIGERYGQLLAWSLKRRRLVIGVVGLVFIGCLALVPRIGGEFMPQTDMGIINVSIELPTGSMREDTERVTQQLEQRIYAIPEVEHVYVRVGSESAFQLGGSTPELAMIQVTLVPLEDRRRSVFEIAEVIRTWGGDIPGASVSASIESGMGGSGGSPIEIEVRGDDEDRMLAVLDEIAALVSRVPGTREVETSVQDERPEYKIEIRRERARELGLTVPQIASAVRTAVDGQVITQYRTGGDELDVRVQLAGGVADDLESLRYVPVASTAAGIVPLGDVVRLISTASPRDLERRDQGRIMTVTADLFGRDLQGVMADIGLGLQELAIPDGIEVGFEGEAQQMQEAFGDLARALGLAVFLVYAILASQFNSFRHPLAIMFSVPLAAIGVIIGLVISGHSLSVPAFIGLIMLAGIVVNNAIVLVDYINTLRERGVEREAALIEAGRTRLRPVLMTTLTTVLAMIPLALGIGEGAETQAPLATVVIGGLTFSTLLTLVVVPIMYLWVDDVGKRWFSRRRKTATLVSADPASGAR